MNMIYFLIGCSILLALIFLAAFFWASRTGQHDDTYTPSVRILFDDDTPAPVPTLVSAPAKEAKGDEDHV